MAESSGSVVSNSVNSHKQSTSEQSTESSKNLVQKVMEPTPFCLDDYRGEEKPKSLENVLSFIQETEPDATKTDVLVGLIYILMLETGFMPKNTEEPSRNDYDFNLSVVIHLSKRLPRGWKQDKLYRMSFTLPTYERHICTVICFNSSDELLVNCIVDGVEERELCCYLDPLLYFSHSENNLRNLHLQNLHGFSMKVKNEICYPAQQFILRFNNIRVSCVEALPTEVIIVLMKYLKTIDFIAFGSTSKDFRKFLDSNITWIRRIERDFGIELTDAQKKFNMSNFICLYKETYCQKNGFNRHTYSDCPYRTSPRHRRWR
nr:F-box only protein 7-like isoform X1 [Leptinotarsa decemlineata]